MNRDILIDEIIDYLEDPELSDTAINSFIRNAEAQMNRLCRVIDMEVCSTEKSVYGQSSYYVPVDFLQMISVSINCSPVKFVTEDTFVSYYSNEIATSDCPVYTFTGGAVRILPVPCGDDDIQMYFYKRIPPLTEEDETNWMLSKNSDVYLFGALMAGATYLQDDERIAIFKAQFDEAINQMNQADWVTKNGAGPLDYA